MNNPKKTYKSEARIQQECFIWFWNTYPQYRGLLFHVDNNSANGKQGLFKKQLGVVPGVSDFMFLFSGKAYCIEMKTCTGTQQPEQVEWEKQVVWQGFDYHICRSLENFKRIIKLILDGKA